MKIATPHGDVSAAWDLPVAPPRAALVLAHGAGGSMTSTGLPELAAALADRGVAVLRFSFAYREQGRRVPDKMPKLVETFAAVADAARREHDVPLLVGGRSMGGRAASHLAAEGFACAGVVLLAYPLHPPGKPERLRVEHLPDVKVPIVWIQGTRDTFATPELLDDAVSSLPNVTFLCIDGADHGFKVRGRKPADVTTELAASIASFAQSNAGAAP